MGQEKFLGEFEQFILLAVLRLEDGAYGTAVRQLLSDLISREVSVGSLYTTLERLEKKGLITSWMGAATAERGGRAKRYFRVTAEGNAALRRSKQALEQMWQGVELNDATLVC